MAADSDGYSKLSAILTCEGDLSDPRFPTQLNLLVNSLNSILGESVKVHKLEPWNSVRVTLSIPREAALRLRQLANEGSQHLRALGILSVQVEGDQVISLRIATGSEPQEIILRTSQDGSSSSSVQTDLGTFLQTNATSDTVSNNNMQVQFKSPNVVCPPDTVVPKVGANSVPPNNVAGNNKPYAGPFPFTSMNQAIHSNRETPFNSLPPPYPAKHPPVTISSPLLVNLLQNDGGKESTSGVSKTPSVRTLVSSIDVSTSTVNSASTLVKPISSTQAISSTISPSALTTNTSIRQNSTIMTSTTNMVNKTPPPPPQYHRALSNPGKVKQSPMPGHQIPNTISNLPNNSFANNSVMVRTTQSVAAPPQQSNLYQQQLTSPSPLLKTLGQPIVAPPKHGMPQKPAASLATFAKGPTPTLVKNIQQKVPNMLNNTHTKLISAQPNVPLPKTPNIYLPQQIKSNYSQSTAPIIPQTVATPSMSNIDMPSASQNFNNVALRTMPSPPPYSVAISRPWDSLVNSNSLMDLTPTLTDLKPDDLDALLPTIEGELTQSPLADLPVDFLTDHSGIISTTDDLPMVNDNRKFLINPLTGELEPQSSGESDTEELKDVFTGLPSPSNFSDEDTCSTTRPDTTTDQSDSETRSSDTNKPQRLKNSKARERGRDSPALKPEKIKLRLKLEKSEPINSAYKVDVSFINQQPKKGTTSLITAGEELRVPPLHISLRGRNSAVIKNKNKLNPDGTPVKLKVRKNQDHQKLKKNEVGNSIGSVEEGGSLNSIAVDVSNPSMLSAEFKARLANIEQKKKKVKTNYEHKDAIASLTQESDLKSKFVIHNHYKEKQKERRGSDSELVKTKKLLDDTAISDDKKRRLSQSEQPGDDQPVLGSTNVGTIMSLPQKIRKDKVKVKDVFKKDTTKNKLFVKNFADKLQTKTVTLPTAGEMNMEAKFKQGLLEGTGGKGIPRPPHRTEIVNHLSTETSTRIETPEVVKVIPETVPIKEKSPEPDKCNTPNSRKSVDGIDKPAIVSVGGVVGSGNGNRSPNSGGNQGEDSGIESMDALSEKSPNQASQSPHADILPPKTQVPNMLDIEAQLAKMEGLNGDSDRIEGGTITEPSEGDVNENKCHQDHAAKCCELTCALQDSIKQDNDSPNPPNKQSLENNIVSSHKVKKDEEDLEPLPVRVTPALYTYSNPDKSRADSESPTISDEDSNSCSTNSTLPGNKQSKSLLEQLLIEIPNDLQGVPSSPSPATRSSVRTRALSKLNSPELNSPVPKNSVTRTGNTGNVKRKRNESDSSNQSLDENKKKSRRVATSNDTTHTTDSSAKRQNESVKTNNLKKHPKLQQEESSDSDEPLSEKVRKTLSGNSQLKTKTGKTSGPGTIANNNTTSSVSASTTTTASKTTMVVSTRRSVRSNMPAQNTRSRGENTKVLDKSESDASRRKTRSAVSDVENKRKKEIK